MKKALAAGMGPFPLQGMKVSTTGQKPGSQTHPLTAGHGSAAPQLETAISAQRLVGPFADRTFAGVASRRWPCSQEKRRTRSVGGQAAPGAASINPGTVGGAAAWRRIPDGTGSCWKNGCPFEFRSCSTKAAIRRAAADPISPSPGRAGR